MKCLRPASERRMSRVFFRVPRFSDRFFKTVCVHDLEMELRLCNSAKGMIDRGRRKGRRRRWRSMQRNVFGVQDILI